MRISEALIGTVQDVVVEGYDGYSDSYYGRTWRDAPEIDSAIKFVCPYDLDEGEMVKVEVFDTEGYDLIGEVFPNNRHGSGQTRPAGEQAHPPRRLTSEAPARQTSPPHGWAGSNNRPARIVGQPEGAQTNPRTLPGAQAQN